MPSKKKDSAKKKAPPVAAAATGSEPDWKEIAITLWRDVNFAAANLKATGREYFTTPKRERRATGKNVSLTRWNSCPV